MRKKFLLAIMIVMSCLVFMDAQKHEIGISLGKANIIGDIGKTNYIELLPMDMDRIPISIGFLYRLNFNNRQSLRLNATYNKVYFDDNKAAEDYRYDRKTLGGNTIIETSALFEYYFFDINDIKRIGSSPYIFGGIAAYAYEDRNYTISHDLFRRPDGSGITSSNPEYFKTETNYSKSSKFDFSIPFGIGYKVKFNYNWLVAFEVGARYTFQDNLDYSALKTEKIKVNIMDPELSNPSGPYTDEVKKRDSDIIGKLQTGNTFKSNDWYLIWGLNLTYTFGRPPCFCY